MTQITDTDRRDIINHSMHFGASALVRKGDTGSKRWWVQFREFGFPAPYATKAEAMQVASNWVRALARVRREEATD